MTVSRLPFESTGIFLNSEIQSVFRSLRKTPVNSNSVAINPPSGEKCGLRESDENHLLQVLAAVQKGKVVELTPSLSTAAAKISLKYKLPMADSIIYTTAQQYDATVWTQDIDFEGLPNVNYFAKVSAGN